MPVVNTILKSNENGQLYRVLWVSKTLETLYLFNLTTQEMPVLMEYSILQEYIVNGVFKIEYEDPFALFVDEAELGDKEKRIRDSIWTSMESILLDEPSIYIKAERGKTLLQAENTTKISLRTLYRYVKLFWL